MLSRLRLSHRCEVKRSGSDHAPLKWRARCAICGAYYLAPGATAADWVLAVDNANVHAFTGGWR